jgi:glycosidase
VCRLQGLPDLNQKIPYVANTLHDWMAWIRDTYKIDGFRVDAAKHIFPVSKVFLLT